MIMEDGEIKDDICLGLEPYGNFSIQLVYNANEENNSRDRDLISKCKILNKVRTFLWLVKHNRLMSNVEREKTPYE